MQDTLAEIVGEQVTVYPFVDIETGKPFSKTGKLSNHKPGYYQVTVGYDKETNEFDFWVFSLVEVQEITDNNIYLYKRNK